MRLRFKAHQSFFIRNGWLHKGMVQLYETMNSSGVSYLFQDRGNAIMKLGIGSNMVSSLKYWLQALGLVALEGRGSGVSFTEFGQYIYKYDKHFQELSSLVLCHYYLVTNKELASAWYYFFNEFRSKEFSKQDLILNMTDWIGSISPNLKIAPKSIESDVDCLLRTYLIYREAGDRFEDNKISPLSSLNLVTGSTSVKNIYNKRPIDFSQVSPYVSMYIIMKQIEEAKYLNPNIDLFDLLQKPNSIGKVFNLQAEQLIELIDQLESFGLVRFVRTAGLEQLVFKKGNISSNSLLRDYFNGISIDE